jgi:signal transduction histidine kinase
VADRRSGLRLAVVLLAGIVLAIEIQSLLLSLQHQTLLQKRALVKAREDFALRRGQLAVVLRAGGPAAWREAARIALDAGLAVEVDFFEPSGLQRLSVPAPAPIRHWPDEPTLAGLRPETEPLVVGPFLQPAARILTYAAFTAGDGLVWVRLSASASALADDLRLRRPLLMGHALAIGLLVLLGALALVPDRERREGGSALGAYEVAMGRLRDQGEAQAREHRAERRQMESLVRDKEAMARAGELTAGMVHEVRNGLATIVGYARLVEKGASTEPRDAETAEAAGLILAECRTLEAVVRRFMEFVRDEALNLAPVDLGRLLERVIARESRSHPGAEVRLGDFAGVPTVPGDEALLERAFENLIRNAREAAGALGHVLAEPHRSPDGRIGVRITDDGPGLAPGTQTVRPFQTTKAGGLGLGLPLALKIVGLHEGELRLRDRSPRGVEVLLLLPALGPSR